MQPSVRLVSTTALARNTRQVIDAVLRGQTVVVEHLVSPDKKDLSEDAATARLGL